jgi:DNA repair protein RecO (recombination protein O)
MEHITQGIVLREVDYKDADKILTVLTRDLGKQTVKSPSCRRKNSRLAAGSQLLVWSELTLNQRGDRLTLKEADPQESFWSVRQDLELLALGSYFAQVTEAAAQEGESSPELLSLLLNALYALDTLKKPQDLVKAAFEIKLLCHMGFAPLVDACAVCGAPEPERARLHLSQGVLHCARCRDQVGQGVSMPLSPSALAALRHIVLGDPKKLFSFSLTGESMAQLAGAAEGFLMTQLERGFRTLDYYKQLRLPSS